MTKAAVPPRGANQTTKQQKQKQQQKKKRNTALSNDPDMISLNHFPAWRGVLLDSKLYNAMGILKGIRNHGLRLVPHSRRPLTPANVRAAMAVLGRVPKDPRRPTTAYNQYESRRSRKRFEKSAYQMNLGSPQHVSLKRQFERLNAAIAAALALYGRYGTRRAVRYIDIVKRTASIRAAGRDPGAIERALVWPLLRPRGFRSFARGAATEQPDGLMAAEIGRLQRAIAAALTAYVASPPTSPAAPSEIEDVIASIRVASTPASVEREVFARLL